MKTIEEQGMTPIYMVMLTNGYDDTEVLAVVYNKDLAMRQFIGAPDEVRGCGEWYVRVLESGIEDMSDAEEIEEVTDALWHGDGDIIAERKLINVR